MSEDIKTEENQNTVTLDSATTTVSPSEGETPYVNLGEDATQATPDYLPSIPTEDINAAARQAEEPGYDESRFKQASFYDTLSAEQQQQVDEIEPEAVDQTDTEQALIDLVNRGKANLKSIEQSRREDSEIDFRLQKDLAYLNPRVYNYLQETQNEFADEIFEDFKDDNGYQFARESNIPLAYQPQKMLSLKNRYSKDDSNLSYNSMVALASFNIDTYPEVRSRVWKEAQDRIRLMGPSVQLKKDDPEWQKKFLVDCYMSVYRDVKEIPSSIFASPYVNQLTPNELKELLSLTKDDFLKAQVTQYEDADKFYLPTAFNRQKNLNELYQSAVSTQENFDKLRPTINLLRRLDESEEHSLISSIGIGLQQYAANAVSNLTKEDVNAISQLLLEIGASYAATTMAGAAIGGAIGTAVVPGAGTVVGGTVGAGTGAVAGTLISAYKIARTGIVVAALINQAANATLATKYDKMLVNVELNNALRSMNNASIGLDGKVSKTMTFRQMCDMAEEGRLMDIFSIAGADIFLTYWGGAVVGSVLGKAGQTVGKAIGKPAEVLRTKAKDLFNLKNNLGTYSTYTVQGTKNAATETTGELRNAVPNRLSRRAINKAKRTTPNKTSGNGWKLSAPAPAPEAVAAPKPVPEPAPTVAPISEPVAAGPNRLSRRARNKAKQAAAMPKTSGNGWRQAEPAPAPEAVVTPKPTPEATPVPKTVPEPTPTVAPKPEPVVAPKPEPVAAPEPMAAPAAQTARVVTPEEIAAQRALINESVTPETRGFISGIGERVSGDTQNIIGSLASQGRRLQIGNVAKGVGGIALDTGLFSLVGGLHNALSKAGLTAHEERLFGKDDTYWETFLTAFTEGTQHSLLGASVFSAALRVPTTLLKARSIHKQIMWMKNIEDITGRNFLASLGDNPLLKAKVIDDMIASGRTQLPKNYTFKGDELEAAIKTNPELVDSEIVRLYLKQKEANEGAVGDLTISTGELVGLIKDSRYDIAVLKEYGRVEGETLTHSQSVEKLADFADNLVADYNKSLLLKENAEQAKARQEQTNAKIVEQQERAAVDSVLSNRITTEEIDELVAAQQSKASDEVQREIVERHQQTALNDKTQQPEGTTTDGTATEAKPTEESTTTAETSAPKEEQPKEKTALEQAVDAETADRTKVYVNTISGVQGKTKASPQLLQHISDVTYTLLKQISEITGKPLLELINDPRFLPNIKIVKNISSRDGTKTLGTYNPETNTIVFVENADFSTVLHENIHYMLEVSLRTADAMADKVAAKMREQELELSRAQSSLDTQSATSARLAEEVGDAGYPTQAKQMVADAKDAQAQAAADSKVIGTPEAEATAKEVAENAKATKQNAEANKEAIKNRGKEPAETRKSLIELRRENMHKVSEDNKKDQAEVSELQEKSRKALNEYNKNETKIKDLAAAIETFKARVAKKHAAVDKAKTEYDAKQLASEEADKAIISDIKEGKEVTKIAHNVAIQARNAKKRFMKGDYKLNQMEEELKAKEKTLAELEAKRSTLEADYKAKKAEAEEAEQLFKEIKQLRKELTDSIEAEARQVALNEVRPEVLGREAASRDRVLTSDELGPAYDNVMAAREGYVKANDGVIHWQSVLDKAEKELRAKPKEGEKPRDRAALLKQQAEAKIELARARDTYTKAKEKYDDSVRDAAEIIRARRRLETTVEVPGSKGENLTTAAQEDLQKFLSAIVQFREWAGLAEGERWADLTPQRKGEIHEKFVANYMIQHLNGIIEGPRGMTSSLDRALLKSFKDIYLPDSSPKVKQTTQQLKEDAAKVKESIKTNLEDSYGIKDFNETQVVLGKFLDELAQSHFTNRSPTSILNRGDLLEFSSVERFMPFLSDEAQQQLRRAMWEAEADIDALYARNTISIAVASSKGKSYDKLIEAIQKSDLSAEEKVEQIRTLQSMKDEYLAIRSRWGSEWRIFKEGDKHGVLSKDTYMTFQRYQYLRDFESMFSSRYGTRIWKAMSYKDFESWLTEPGKEVSELVKKREEILNHKGIISMSKSGGLTLKEFMEQCSIHSLDDLQRILVEIENFNKDESKFLDKLARDEFSASVRNLDDTTMAKIGDLSLMDKIILAAIDKQAGTVMKDLFKFKNNQYEYVFEGPDGKPKRVKIYDYNSNLKQEARNELMFYTLSDLSPQRFANEATRLFKLAANEAAKGNIEAAGNYMRGSQLKNAMAVQASAWKKAVETRLNSAKDTFLKPDEVLAKYYKVEEMRKGQLLLSYMGRGNIEAFFNRKEQASMINPKIVEELDNFLGSQEKLLYYKDMSLRDLLENLDKLESIRTNARKIRESEQQGKALAERMDIDEVLKYVDRELLETYRNEGLLADTVDVFQNNREQPFYKSVILNPNMLSTVKMEYFCEMLQTGTNGKVKDILYTPLRDAQTKYTMAERQLAIALDGIYKEADREFGKPLSNGAKTYTFRTESGQVLNVNYYNNVGNKEQGPLVLGGSRKYKGRPRTELFGIMLHMGNDSNKARAAASYGISVEDLESAIRQAEKDGVITDAMWESAQKIWNLYDTLLEDSLEAFYKLNGYYFDVVPKRGFTTTTGATFEGGYIPVVYVEEFGRNLKDINVSDYLNQTASEILPQRDPNFTRSRSGGVVGRQIDFDPADAVFGLKKQLKFQNFAEPVTHLYSLVGDSTLARKLNMIRDGMTDTYRTWLVDVLSQNTTGHVAQRYAKANMIALRILSNSNASALAGNIGNILTGFANFAPMIARIGVDGLITGFRHMLSFKEVKATSAFMNERLSFTRNSVAHACSRLDHTLLNRIDRPLTFLNDYSYYVQARLQGLMDVIAWTGAYNKALSKGIKDIRTGKTLKMAKEDAIKYADATVRDTQGSFDMVDKSAIERSNALVRFFTPFCSYFTAMGNLVRTDLHNAGKYSSAFERYWNRAMFLTFEFYLPSVLGELLTQTGKGAWWDKSVDNGEVLASAFMYGPLKTSFLYASPFASPFGVGVDMMAGKSFGSNALYQNMAVSILTKFFSSTKDVVTGDIDEKTYLGFLSILQSMYGVTGAVVNNLNRISKWNEKN